MNDDDLLELTIENLRWLRLPGMARTLTDLIESAKQQPVAWPSAPVHSVPTTWSPMKSVEMGPSQTGGDSTDRRLGQRPRTGHL